MSVTFVANSFNLPPELTVRVFGHLNPMKDRLVCRKVCSGWNKILGDATLWRKECAVLGMKERNLSSVISIVKYLQRDLYLHNGLFDACKSSLIDRFEIFQRCLPGLGEQ